MKRIILLLMLIICISLVSGYTAPDFDSIDFVVPSGSYTAPDFDSIDFVVQVGPPANDTCTYTSGDWKIDCSDNCNITSQVDLGGNDITIIGTGTFSTTSNIINYGNILIKGTDASNRCIVTCNGGCFKN